MVHAIIASAVTEMQRACDGRGAGYTEQGAGGRSGAMKHG